MILPTLLALAASPQDTATRPEPKKPADALEVTYLANEGFLLRVGDAKVLFDAFVTQPYGQYAALDGATASKLFAAEPPFDSIDLALTSHVHRDHFQVSAACRFLDASPDCVFASTPDVVATLKRECEPVLADRVKSYFPKAGHTDGVEAGGVRVDVFRLSHGTGRFESIQNLGQVVTIGGFKVLHLGDAAYTEANYAPYGLAELEIDVAFVPYWYFSVDEARSVLAKHLKARTLVAVHVPPREVAKTKALLSESYPDVVLFEKSLQSRRFERR